MAEPQPNDNWLNRLKQRLKPKSGGDVIAGKIGAGSRGIAVGKNIIQIGTVVIPTVPLLGLLLLSVAGLIFLGFSQVGPARMPAGSFNVAVAEIGQIDAQGQAHPSPDGRQLSAWIFKNLQRDYQELLPEAGVVVWHDSMGLKEKRVKLGIIANAEAAVRLANRINANLVIYGNLMSDGNATNFVPEFYVTPLRGEAGELNEISGPYQLGSPIPLQLPIDFNDPVSNASLKPKVTLRARALSWFTVGFIWDLAGATAKAFKTFQQAEQDLKEWGEKNEGKEVLYHFIGRQALTLSRSEQEAQQVFQSAQAGLDLAEKYFKKALDSNPDYGRARIGLAGVYYLRAQNQSPEQRLGAPDLDQAIDQYQQALAQTAQNPTSQVNLEARFGLAITTRLKGDTYLKLNNYDQAQIYFDEAAGEIQPILAPLTATGQQRLLAQVYLALGVIYSQQAIIRQNQTDPAGSVAFYKEAQAAFAGCVAQGDSAQGGNPYDALISDIIATYCQPYNKIAEKARLVLEGTP